MERCQGCRGSSIPQTCSRCRLAVTGFSTLSAACHPFEVLYVTDDPMHAQRMAEVLEWGGIPCFIADDALAAMGFGDTDALSQCLQLIVPSKQISDAKQLLRSRTIAN